MKHRLITFLVKYFNQLTVAVHELPSLIGFFIFMIIYNQLVSGTMLALSLSTEPMNIPLAREEEDCENIYTDDFFFLHEWHKGKKVKKEFACSSEKVMSL